MVVFRLVRTNYFYYEGKFSIQKRYKPDIILTELLTNKYSFGLLHLESIWELRYYITNFVYRLNF